MAFKVIAQFRPGYPQSSSSVQAPMWIDITERVDFQSLQWEQQATDKNTSLRFDIFTFFPLSNTRYDEYASWSGKSAPVDPNDIDPRLSDAIHDVSFFIELTNRAEVKLLNDNQVIWGGVIGTINTERSGSAYIVQQVEAYDYTALLDEIVVRDYNAPNVSESIGELPTQSGLTSQVITGGNQLIAGPYTFRIIATTEGGDVVKIFTHITQYITPTDVNPANITDTPLRTIQLDWSAVPGADEFIIYAKQGIGTTGLYRQASTASTTYTYQLSTIPVTNTVTSPEKYVQKGSVDVDIISGSSDPENANYKGIFNAIDPNLDPGINNFDYVKPAKVLADGSPDPDASYRFSPVLETGVILTSPFGGKTLKQAMKTISDKTGSIFWVDAAKNLHYANKKAQELVQNPRFDSSSTNWTLGTNHTIDPQRGPFGFGNALVASTSSSTNESKSDPISITSDVIYMARVRGWADTNFNSNWDCELRFYSDDAGINQVGNSHKLKRSVSFDGTDEQRWSKTWVIAKAHATAVSARLVAKRKNGSSGACAWTDFSLIEITGSYGFSDQPSESLYDIPLRGFETPKAPREASGIANRLLVYGVYKDPTNTNELESVEYNAGLTLTKAQGGSLAANTYWVRVVAETPDGDVYVKYDTEIITDADVAAPTPVRTLSANWSAVPAATMYRIYIGAGRMTMRLKATQIDTSITITSLPASGATLSGEPDVYYYKTFDFAPGLWESGGKVVEASLNDQLVDSETKAEVRALGFWEEKGIAMRTWEFDHLEEAPEVGTVIPFIWAADDIAEPLVVKGTKGKFLGDKIYWTTTLGSDPSLIKKGVTQIFADLKQATLRLNDVLPPARPSNLTLAAPSSSLIQTVDGVSRATVVAKWTPSQEDDFSNYVVQYGYDVNFANAQVINVAQTPEIRSASTGVAAQVTHSFQAEPGKKLYFRVAAQDRTGNRSDFVDDSVVLPSDTTPPDAPTNVQVTASLKSIAITWSFGFYDPAIPDQNTNNTDFSRFKVYRKQYNVGTNPNEPWEKIAETSTNVYIDTSFPNYTNLYQYKVSTVDRTGNESAAVQETTPTYRSPNKITGTVDIEDATITSAQISSLTANLITAGTLNISTGMSVISDGTATLPQFEVDKDGVTIRDDAGNIVLQVNGNTSTLNADYIDVTNLAATEITVGSGDSVVRVGNYPNSVSPTFQGIWGGAANPSSAAFTLAKDGAVTASNITATGGTIGGWTVGAATISSSSGNVVLNNNGIITAGSSSPSQAHMSGNGFWAGAGASAYSTAPFRVSTTGGVTAKNISVIGGTVSVGDAPVGITYLSRSASGLVTVKTSASVNATVGQNITVDVTSSPWATDADFNGAFNVLSITGSAPYTITYQGSTSSAVTEVAATGYIYTGARITGESASGTWFTVDSGFALKNPANVSQNIITATASDVTINADFIKAGTVTLGNLGANAISSTNFSVSNTGTITAKDGTVGGWTLASTKLSSGTSTSYVAIATSGGYSIYAGSETASAAPFSVTPGGSVKAESGTIGGWSLAQYSLTAGSGANRAGIATSGGYSFYAGDEDPSLAEFRVTPSGALTTSNITATGGTIGGWTLASTPSRLHAGGGSAFVGLSADTTSLATTIFAGATDNTGTGAKFKVINDGSATASNISITGGPSGGNVINVNSGTFSVTSAGAMTATSATVNGSITATSGSIGGWAVDSARIYNALASSPYISGMQGSSTSTGVAFFAGGTTSTGATASFKVTNDGALTATNATITGAVTATSGSFTGSITANAGSIGGWTIATDRIWSGSGSSYVGMSTGTTSFFAGANTSSGASALFSVTNAGALTASSGTVGGFTLTDSALYMLSTTYSGLLKSSTSTGTVFFAGASTSAGGSSVFSVGNDGALNATNLQLGGPNLTIGNDTAAKIKLVPSSSQQTATLSVENSDGTNYTSYGYVSNTAGSSSSDVTITISGGVPPVGSFIYANSTASATLNSNATANNPLVVKSTNGTNAITVRPTGSVSAASGGTGTIRAVKKLSVISGAGLWVYQDSTAKAGAIVSGSIALGSSPQVYGSGNYGTLADGELGFLSSPAGTNNPKFLGGANLYSSDGINSLDTSGKLWVHGSSLEVGVNGSTSGLILVRGDNTTGGRVALYSGSGSTGGTLAWDVTNSRFSMNNDLAISGGLSGVTTLNASGILKTTSASAGAIDIQQGGIYAQVGTGNGLSWYSAGAFQGKYAYSTTAGQGHYFSGIEAVGTVAAYWSASSTAAYLGRTSSSMRYKENINSVDFDMEDIVSLSPVLFTVKDQYRQKDENGNPVPATVNLGIIAEHGSGNPAWEKLVVHSADTGEIDSWAYQHMGVVLLSATRQLHQKTKDLEARIAELESR
jgi:hypothetical protein